MRNRPINPKTSLIFGIERGLLYVKRLCTRLSFFPNSEFCEDRNFTTQRSFIVGLKTLQYFGDEHQPNQRKSMKVRLLAVTFPELCKRVDSGSRFLSAIAEVRLNLESMLVFAALSTLCHLFGRSHESQNCY